MGMPASEKDQGNTGLEVQPSAVITSDKRTQRVPASALLGSAAAHLWG
jgi:hypothetical protein